MGPELHLNTSELQPDGGTSRPPSRGLDRRPRRVLYFNSWSSAHGGSATSLIDLVCALDPARYHPIVLCPEAGELPDRLRGAGIDVRVHALSVLNREHAVRFIAEIPAYMRLLWRDGIDLVHGNTAATRRSIVQAAAFMRVPYVQHVRNAPLQLHDRYGYRLARRIITNSQSVAEVFKADHALAKKTVTIYNAVDLAHYDDDTDTRHSEVAPPGTPIVGFVGHIVPDKGITTLLDAMPQVLQAVPNARFVLVGRAPDGYESFEQECRDRVAAMGIADRVTWTGYRHDVPAWMRTFSVFAFPTRREAFGKVVIEAMAARCPVVASRVGGVPEIIADTRVGALVPVDDAAALARGVITYLQDAVGAAHVGEAGAAHVRRLFTLPAMAASLQDLYDEVLDERRR